MQDRNGEEHTGLCLSFRDGDYAVLVLPDDRTVRVTVELDLRHWKARLHFESPPDVRIWRDKIWEDMQTEQAQPQPQVPEPQPHEEQRLP